MTKCSMKNCKNNSSIKHKKDGITYHRFPQDYITRENWRKIVARNRSDEFYKPNDSSIICSNHFLESDIYITKKGFRRVKRSAIPQIQETDSGSDYLKSARTVTVPIHYTREGESSACTKFPYEMEIDNLHGSDSEISSILNAPKSAYLSKQLKKCHEKMNTKNRQIRNLKKQIKRLIRKNEFMNKILKDYIQEMQK